MKLKSIFFALFFLVLSVTITANENIRSDIRKIEYGSNFSSNDFADHFLFKRSSLRLAFGVTSFFGDIMQKETLGTGYSLHLEVPTKSSKHLAQLGLIIGSITGKDFSSNYTLAAEPLLDLNNGEVFEMQFIELDINYVINLSKLYIENGNQISPRFKRLELLCKIGVGLNMFRSLRKEVQTEKFINSYGYEWNWQNNFENAGTVKGDNVKERVLLFGVISKYNITDRLALDFCITSRYGNTDKWDAKVQNSNDMFMFYSLGTNFRINKN